MQFTKKTSQVLVAVGAMLLLTACGGAPSEGDIKSAIDRSMADTVKTLAQFGTNSNITKSVVPEIKNVKKIGCKEDGEKAYKCDVELEVSLHGNTTRSIAPMRFVKGSDGWIATK